MDTDLGRAQSAAFLFNFSGAEVSIFLRAFGHPEQVRKCLRAACSHRRSIVVARPNTFVSNAHMHLARQSQDVAEIWNGREAYDISRTLYNWNYVIQPEGLRDDVYMHMYSKGAQQPMRTPLFSFLGTEYKRGFVLTPARKKALKGRPKEMYLMNDMWKKMEGWTPAQKARYERLSKARAAKSERRIAEQQQTTTKRVEDALGLKHKRIVKVDFTGVERMDRSRSETFRMFEEPDYDDQHIQMEKPE